MELSDIMGWLGATLGTLGGAFAAWKLFTRPVASKPDAPPPPATPGTDPSPVDETPPARDVFGVPFAAGTAMPVWPLAGDRKSNTQTYPGGTHVWARGKVTADFGDARPFGSASPTRHHAGEDLRAPRHSVLVATERGRIVTIDEDWYAGSNGITTGALLVAMDSGIVVNFGEVEPGSTRALGLDVGSIVERGSALAQVGATNMVHFETYAKGTTITHRWPWKGPAPTSLLDPTRYLERAAKTVPA